jgi:hypothetical protein
LIEGGDELKRFSIILMTVLCLTFFQFWPDFPIHSLETDTVSAATSKSPAGPSETWSSQPSSWAVQDIQKAGAYGLTVANLMNQYNRPITRLEFVQLVMKQYAASGGSLDGAAELNTLSDSSDNAALSAYNLVIINGSGDGKFNPDRRITRQEAAVILFREWKLLSTERTDPVIYPRVFSDSARIAYWAEDAVRYMNQLGILRGLIDGKIDPSGNTTREQAMILVLRSYEAHTADASRQTVEDKMLPLCSALPGGCDRPAPFERLNNKFNGIIACILLIRR